MKKTILLATVSVASLFVAGQAFAANGVINLYQNGTSGTASISQTENDYQSNYGGTTNNANVTQDGTSSNASISIDQSGNNFNNVQSLQSDSGASATIYQGTGGYAGHDYVSNTQSEGAGAVTVLGRTIFAAFAPSLTVYQGVNGNVSTNSAITNTQKGNATATLTQVGDNNQISTTQTDVLGAFLGKDSFTASQNGNNNSINSSQSGYLLTASVTQVGDNNASNGVQTGSNNSATVSQMSNGNLTNYTQSGHGNVATLTQH